MFDQEKARAEIVARHDAEFPNESTCPAGPTREAGTQRTRLNAYKHGLTGQIHLLTAAEQTAFDAHCQSICEALAPVGALEIDIAQAIAEDRWRLKRARAIETGIFAAGQQGLLGFNPGNPSVGNRKTQPSFSSKIPSSKPAPGSPRTTISCFSLSMSSASTAPLRGIWPNCAPCGPNAKPPVIKRSKKPCFSPNSHRAKAKSTIR
jgi:hypothetical protein